MLSSLLLSLLLSPIYSAEEPEAMTDEEILTELSAISERQQKRWETLGEELPKLQTDLRALSASLETAEMTLSAQTNSLESSVKELEKEARRAEAWNVALLVLTGVAGGLAAWALIR